jgi:pSer/pThr/pTyr-binding forkhead associated (FHA) protein
VRTGNSSGMQVCLVRGSEGQQAWTVGSDPGCDLQLTDSGVSGLHARIVNEGVRWKVVDEMSANGTFVNDKRSPNAYLATNDLVRFGRVECLLQLPRARAPSRRTGAPAAVGTSWRRTAIVVAVSFVLTAIVLYAAYRLLR